MRSRPRADRNARALQTASDIHLTFCLAGYFPQIGSHPRIKSAGMLFGIMREWLVLPEWIEHSR
jgi:hypothetical protein